MINPKNESEKIRLEQTVIGRNRDGVEVYIGHEGTLVSLIKFRNYTEFFDADHNSLNPELIADGFRKEFLDKPLGKKDPRQNDKPTGDEFTDNFEIEPEEFDVETGEFVYREESEEVELDKEPQETENSDVDIIPAIPPVIENTPQEPETEKEETVVADKVELEEISESVEEVKESKATKTTQAKGKNKGK